MVDAAVETFEAPMEPSTVRDSNHSTDHVWQLYIAAGLVVMAAYFAVHGWISLNHPIVKVILYCLVSGSAAVAIGVGIRRHRPAQSLPWVLLLANQGCTSPPTSVSMFGTTCCTCTRFRRSRTCCT